MRNVVFQSRTRHFLGVVYETQHALPLPSKSGRFLPIIRLGRKAAFKVKPVRGIGVSLINVCCARVPNPLHITRLVTGCLGMDARLQILVKKHPCAMPLIGDAFLLGMMTKIR